METSKQDLLNAIWPHGLGKQAQVSFAAAYEELISEGFLTAEDVYVYTVMAQRALEALQQRIKDKALDRIEALHKDERAACGVRITLRSYRQFTDASFEHDPVWLQINEEAKKTKADLSARQEQLKLGPILDEDGVIIAEQARPKIDTYSIVVENT